MTNRAFRLKMAQSRKTFVENRREHSSDIRIVDVMGGALPQPPIPSRPHLVTLLRPTRSRVCLFSVGSPIIVTVQGPEGSEPAVLSCGASSSAKR
jgi:hypothetical protein